MKVKKNNLHLIGVDNKKYSNKSEIGKQVLKVEEVFKKMGQIQGLDEKIREKVKKKCIDAPKRKEEIVKVFEKVSRFF